MGLDNHRGIENVSLVGDQVGLRANGIVKLLNMAEKKIENYLVEFWREKWDFQMVWKIGNCAKN